MGGEREEKDTQEGSKAILACWTPTPGPIRRCQTSVRGCIAFSAAGSGQFWDGWGDWDSVSSSPFPEKQRKLVEEERNGQPIQKRSMQLRVPKQGCAATFLGCSHQHQCPFHRRDPPFPSYSHTLRCLFATRIS